MKRTMNTRGITFLNISQIAIALVCVFLAYYLLSVADTQNELKANERTAEFRDEYQSLQLLRTFAQSELPFENERISVAFALNEYFELSQKENKKDDETQRQQELYFQLRQYIFTHLQPHIADGKTIEIHAKLIKNNEEIKSIILYDTVYNFNSLRNGISFADSTIQLPAYFEDDISRIGSYYIEIELLNKGSPESVRDRAIEVGG